jgi:signal transduction histidine kinase
LKKEQELNRLKSEFVSITSHEFRNPLAVIKAATENLINYAHKFSEEKKRKRLLNIQKSCDYMHNLLEEVLVLAKLESGNFTYNPAFLDFGAFCLELISEFEMLSQEKSIALNLQISGDCDRLWLDQKLISLAMHNLLGNAIKFSPPACQIQVNVRCDAAILTVAIVDQGIGIPAEDLDKLFKSFHRASNAEAIEGTGLGLSIAKQVIELCSGTIEVDSALGKGSTFTLKLPCAPGIIPNQPNPN